MRAVYIPMRKLRALPMKDLAACLININNYLPLLPGSDNSNKMEEDYLKEILLHDVLNEWFKEAYLQGWYFGVRSFWDTYDILY